MCIAGELPVSHWPPGDSETAELIRTFRWAGTPLGRIESWPQSLKTAVEFMLSCGFPSFIHWGPEATLLYNDACAGVLGVHHPGALGGPVFEATPVRRACWARVLNRVMVGERVNLSEVSHLVADGEGEREIWVDGYASPLRDESGAVAGLWAVFIDITSRIQAEQRRAAAEASLRETEALLSAILERAPMGIGVCGEDGEWVFVNPALSAISARMPSLDAAFLRAWKFVDETGNPMAPWDWPAPRALRGETVSPGVVFSSKLNGETRWIRIAAAPFHAGTESGRAIVIAEDVTAQKQAEERLRESEKRLHAIMNHAPEAIFIKDRQSRYLFMNEHGARTLNLRRADVIGRNDRELVSPELAAQLRANDEQVWTCGMAQVMEESIPEPDGVHTYLAHKFLLRDASGTPYALCGIATDITERKRNEERLRESEERLRLAQEAAHAGVFDWNLATDKFTCTPELDDIFGFELGKCEDPREAWSKWVHLEDLPRIEAEIAAWLQSSREEQQSEYRYLRDGELCWISVHARLFRDSAGSPQRMIGTVLDITARKETEEARRQSEAKLKRLQDSNIIGIVTANSSHIVEANQVFLDMIGYTEAELHGAKISWRSITPPEHLPAGERAIAQLMTAGVCEPLEKEYIRKDGTRVPVLVGAAAYRRDPLEWVCFVLDLTRRKRAEEALRESEEWRAAALRAGKLGVYDYNPQSGRLKWDREAYRLWGVPEGEEVSYETFEASVHPNDLNAVKAALERAFDPAGTHRYECEYRIVARADGSVRWISADGDVTFEDGQPVRLVGTVEDVTERKRAHERIHLLMREVNHRSKNMLSIVQAIARQTITSSPEDFLERFGDRIEALAASQDLLVKNAWKGVALADLVRSQLALFEDLIDARIELSGPPVLISASAAQTLGMALHELATNAGKYGALSNCHGRVGIEWEIEPAEMAEDAFIMQWCESGGPPVAAPIRKGFGSAIISETPETSLDAKVHLDFARTGLTWRLQCPASEVLEECPSLASSKDVHRANGTAQADDAPRVLIVEDEPIVAFEIAQILQEGGFSAVGPVRSVAQALELLRAHGCDAAVLDINLGEETSELVAMELIQIDTPFVTVSGYSAAQRPPVFNGAPALSKPVRPDMLIHEVRRCLDNRMAHPGERRARGA